MKNTKEAERIESEMRNCIKNLYARRDEISHRNTAKIDFLAIRSVLLDYYRNPTDVIYVGELFCSMIPIIVESWSFHEFFLRCFSSTHIIPISMVSILSLHDY